MITLTIPSSRPKVKTYHQPHQFHVVNNHVLKGELTIEQEIARRQDIIDGLLLNFHYKIGDRIVFKDESPFGEYKITYIVKRYHEIKDEWPASDNPLIISVQSDDLPKEFFNCTTNKIGKLAK